MLSGIVVGLPACDLLTGEKCGRGDALPYFDVEGTDLVATSAGRVVGAGESVRTADLRLLFTLQKRFYASAGLVPAAVACSPAEPGYKGTTEALDSLTVTSRYDYDAQHPAGTPLNDLLLTSPVGGTRLANLPLNDWSLQLAHGPAQPSTQHFVWRLRLRNGEVYTAESVPMHLIP
ncbi:hypothetical protein GCM10027048_26180 [Hymenobacter coalescens]